MLATLSTLERTLMQWTLRAAVLLLALTCCISLYQVVTRFLLEQPSTWSEVVARSLNIWMVYLGVAVGFRTGAMMSVDFLFQRLRGTARLVLLAFITGVSLGVMAVLVWYGIEMASRVRFQTLAGVLNPLTGAEVSISLVYAAIPTGAALAVVGLLARAAEQIRESRASADGAPARELFKV